MKRTQRGMILTFVVSLAFVLGVLPAQAGRPGNPGKPSPAAGTTCLLGAPAGYRTAEQTTDFTITLGPGTLDAATDACIDVWTQAQGAWWISWSVNDGEAIRSLAVVPRDSFGPGDSCGGLSFKAGTLPPDGFQVPPDPALYPESPYGDTIPMPYVNACGTEFAELVDGVLHTAAEPEVVSPLALVIGMRATRNAVVTVCVDLPPMSGFCG